MPILPTNEGIADTFEEVARLLEAQDADPFRIRAWRDGAKTLRGHPEAVWRVAFDSTGRRLISYGADHSIHVWDVASGKPLAAFNGYSARLLPGGQRLLSWSDPAGSEAGFSVEEHDLASGTVVRARMALRIRRRSPPVLRSIRASAP